MREIRFHARVASENLPFAPGSFEAVSGQYALEYTEMAQSLREIHRVLVSGGRAQFLVHHADSVIARNARESLRQSALVLEETKVFRKLRRHLKSAERATPAARRSLNELVALVGRLRAAGAGAGDRLILDVTVDAVHKLLMAREQLSQAALALEAERVETAIRASVHRLQELIRCCQTEAGIRQIERCAADQGFEVAETVPQYHRGANFVGWRLRLARP